MASNTEQCKIQIIADGKKVNVTFSNMTAAAKHLQNQLKKLVPDSDEFAKKFEQLKGVKSKIDKLKRSVYGTEKALKTMNTEFPPSGCRIFYTLLFLTIFKVVICFSHLQWLLKDPLF